MKKITLLVLFSTLLTSIYAQSAYDAFHQPDKKLYPDRIIATDRSDFPVLLVDSTYFEYWYNNVIDNQEYTKFFYDPAELQIAEHRHNVYLNQGGPASITNSITSYAYDQNKRRILVQTARTSEFGDYIGEQKEETIYNGSGIKNYTLTGWGKNADRKSVV